MNKYPKQFTLEEFECFKIQIIKSSKIETLLLDISGNINS